MNNWQQRTELLIGEQGIISLADAHVLVVGVGGVGAYAAEMLVRAGVGHITIVDGDDVNETNLNRQLIALNSTLGRNKIEVMGERLLDINPQLKLRKLSMFLTAEQVESLFHGNNYNYVIDAIDTIAPKVALIKYCLYNKIKIISSMGAGGRIDPTKISYGDISETINDGLARAVRVKLKEIGIKRGLKVVWSSEAPRRESLVLTDESQNKKSSYGTISYLPCMFGCMLASQVIIKLKDTKR